MTDKSMIATSLEGQKGDHFRFLLAIYRLAKQGMPLTTETIGDAMNKVSSNVQLFPQGADRLTMVAVNTLAEELKASGYIDYPENSSGGGFIVKLLHRKDPNRTITDIIPTEKAFGAINKHIENFPLAYAEFYQLHPRNFPDQGHAR